MTNRKELTEILERFQELVVEAFADCLGEEFMQKSFRDFDNQGDQVDGSPVELDTLSRIERIILLENNLLPVHFLEEGAVVQRAVARVVVPGKWRGTGFMVSRSLLLTNNHVLPSAALANAAKVEFNYQLDCQGTPQIADTFSLDANDVFYTSAPLDFTLVRVKSKRCGFFRRANTSADVGVADEELYHEQTPTEIPNPVGAIFPIQPQPFRPYVYAGAKWGYLKLQRTIRVIEDQHLNIVQHPRARRKEVALQDNRITDIFSNVLRYTTDTEPGSSGAPVFNNGWDLVALHHAAGERQNGRWISNEGIRVDRIVAELHDHFGGSASGDAILAELGI